MRKDLIAYPRKKEVKHMKKGLVIFMAVALLFAFTSIALAADKGNIEPNTYNLNAGEAGSKKIGDWAEYERGIKVRDGSVGSGTSTHLYGTWNSPYSKGIDGYNYNDPQDYVTGANQVDRSTGETVTVDSQIENIYFTSGPHGGYLTSTHKCRECHAVHRAAGKFKLTRSDTRFEACDWCHGTGAGSGYNIQMDNDDNYSMEYNVGHTMGFGIESGKWKAPDDTYPAFTPNYWQGGFSCFDCHSPHANPARMLGFNDDGHAVGIKGKLDGKIYGILNSGSGGTWEKALKADNNPQGVNKPFWPSGTWLLVKNPDREIATTDTTVKSGIWVPKEGSSLDGDGVNDPNLTLAEFIAKIVEPEKDVIIKAGQEIPDNVTADLYEFDTDTAYPVNKLPTDWSNPLGTVTKSLWRASAEYGGGITANYNKSTGEAVGLITERVRRSDAQAAWAVANPSVGGANPSGDYKEPGDTPCTVWTVSEFCTDCHDGNAGLHTIKAPLFSEDRALRSGDATTDRFKENYDLAYGHDAQPRHCGRQMVFNPEDKQDFGPHCRNCHKGSSRCSVCHDAGAYTDDPTIAANQTSAKTLYTMMKTSDAETSDPNNELGSNREMVSPSYGVGGNSTLGFFQKSRTVAWDANWRTSDTTVTVGSVSGDCSDDGFSWPHRTLGWKMLKDDLFGIDVVDGKTVAIDVGETTVDSLRNSMGQTSTHDLDSVCLDCHNPTVWNATGPSHVDEYDNTADNHNDELLTRGLP